MNDNEGDGLEMVTAVCFGAAGGGKRLYPKISEKYEIKAYVDNDRIKWGGELFGVPICNPNKLMEMEYDYLVITSAPGLETICEQCAEMGIPAAKIITAYVEMPLESRRIFLKNLSEMPEFEALSGECAEAGVFEGDFARYINEYFPNRVLHLFDTFEGFDERDIEKEKGLSAAKTGEYGNTSEEKVMKKMPFPNQCVIHKGFFPQTAEKMNNRFCFVNLDLDLYEPTYQGLLFFGSRMVQGGVILVHDYFTEDFKGPREAVDRFVREMHMRRIALYKHPIGDGLSILLVGF